MKKLSELFPSAEADVLIKGISINSKEVVEGDLFVCTMGVNADRHDFIDDAIEHGASAIVVSKDVGEKSVPVIKVSDTNKEFPLICQRFYDYPDKKLKIFAVTGTDGKTSTAIIMRALLGNDVCGYIGTNGIIWNGGSVETSNTTPDAHILYKYFDRMVKDGCLYVAMETSSEAFFRGRLQTIDFDYSAYTNITPEHLNIHGTLENYIESKCMLFEQTKFASAINKDDKYFDIIKEHCKSDCLTYGKGEENDLQIADYKLFATYTDITFKYKGELYNFKSPLLAEFNIYNLAAGFLSVVASGKDINEVISNVSTIKVPGRLEVLDTKTPYHIIVDFAHTTNGIANVLSYANSIDHNKIIALTGSAGERDYQKRPSMGKVCLENADHTIFTSDDSREEPTIDIINQLIGDLKDNDNYSIIIDRKEAIQKAVDMAEEGDLIFLLGKGVEPFLKLGKEVLPYDEKETAYAAVTNRKNRES